jgi:hypothetical protein
MICEMEGMKKWSEWAKQTKERKVHVYLVVYVLLATRMPHPLDSLTQLRATGFIRPKEFDLNTWITQIWAAFRLLLIFLLFDRDCDRRLSYAEFSTLVRCVPGGRCDEEYIVKLAKAFPQVLPSIVFDVIDFLTVTQTTKLSFVHMLESCLRDDAFRLSGTSKLWRFDLTGLQYIHATLSHLSQFPFSQGESEKSESSSSSQFLHPPPQSSAQKNRAFYDVSRLFDLLFSSLTLAS